MDIHRSIEWGVYCLLCIAFHVHRMKPTPSENIKYDEQESVNTSHEHIGPSESSESDTNEKHDYMKEIYDFNEYTYKNQFSGSPDINDTFTSDIHKSILNNHTLLTTTPQSMLNSPPHTSSPFHSPSFYATLTPEDLAKFSVTVQDPASIESLYAVTNFPRGQENRNSERRKIPPPTLPKPRHIVIV